MCEYEKVDRLKFRFDFNWKLTVFVIFLFPVLLRLGFWQLDRASEKRDLESRWLEQQAQPVLDVFKLNEKSDKEAFRRVRVTGRFLLEKYWLQENQVNNGSLGYQVVMLFKTQSNQYLAVDRGWVSGSPLRDFIPEINTPEKEISLSGMLVIPSDSKLIRESEISVKRWPHKILEIDLDVMASQYGKRIFHKLLRLDADSQGALVVNWKPINMAPEKHLGYAFQWFALSFALVVLYVFASSNVAEYFRKRNN